MKRVPFLLPAATCALILAGHGRAQMLVTTDVDTDSVVGFSAVDGSFLGVQWPIETFIQVCAIEVGDEVWVSQQIPDRIKRYDHCGNWLGDIGPTFAGGGLDNVRGMVLHNGIVYACNAGGSNGATPDSLVAFDPAGNWLATYPLANSNSPFGVTPFQGDLLVTSSSTADDVHRYTLAGVPVGTFHNSSNLNFAHQVLTASDGNVWCCGSSTDNVVKLDATTGAILLSIPVVDARGVAELANGNVLVSGGNGVFVYDVVTTTQTQVLVGSCYQLNLVSTDYACHKRYGQGCHGDFDASNAFQLFPDYTTAKTTLDGNAMTFTFTGDGYLANWLPGAAAALYVAPSPGATVVADASTTTETFTPSQPTPIPGGFATSWSVSSEGVLTAGPEGNEQGDITPSLSDITSSEGLAFYTWLTQNPTEAGSGKIKWEEVGNVVVVTFDGVEAATGSPTTAPGTYQWQIDTATGTVTMVWVSMTPAVSTSDILVGCTLAGTGFTPVSQNLTALANHPILPDPQPMALSAFPPPIIDPNTVVTYTATNVPEFVPGSGVYLGTMFLSVNPLPGGFDLLGILTTVPGCNAHIATLDLDLGAAINVAPTLSWTFDFSDVFFAPGNAVAAQAVALFDPAFPQPNGESGGFLLSNGVLSTTFVQ